MELASLSWRKYVRNRMCGKIGLQKDLKKIHTLCLYFIAFWNDDFTQNKKGWACIVILNAERKLKVKVDMDIAFFTSLHSTNLILFFSHCRYLSIYLSLLMHIQS